jgi:hypothetical protein
VTILRKSLFFVCLTAASGCLIAGLASTSAQWLAWTGLIPAVALLFTRRVAGNWLSFTALVAFVGMAAAGLLLGSAPSLMVFSSTAALASWDLCNLERSLDARPHPLLEKRHIQILIPSLGVGLLLALAGGMISLSLPFIVILLLVFLIFFSLDRVFRYLNQHGT